MTDRNDRMLQLETVDWSSFPAPENDGACNHLENRDMPDVPLRATTGDTVNLSRLPGTAVVYIYPMTGRPDRPLPHGWDMLPGARGCTPQSCSFRDHFEDLKQAGADYVFGLSTQETDYQSEAAERLYLPFLLLSDASHTLSDALRLPTFEVDGHRLTKRLTLIVRDGKIVQVFYPVFPPDRNAEDVVGWLRQHVA